jgi:metal-sulfur cluster biosynthetic enzyme
MSTLEHKIWQSLKQIYDPEIPVNIADLGLIYEVHEYIAGHIDIKMTVTSRYCPAAAFLPDRVKEAAQSEEGVSNVRVEVVYAPAWTTDQMSDNARKILGYK